MVYCFISECFFKGHTKVIMHINEHQWGWRGTGEGGGVIVFARHNMTGFEKLLWI